MAKNDVIVKITQKQVAGSAGFGVPLIVQGRGTTAKEYAEYSSLDEIMEANFEQDGPIYKQCSKLFMQNDRPASIAVCIGTGTVMETLSELRDKDFRQVIPILGEEDSSLKELAEYIETTEDKMLFIKVADTAALSDIGQLDRTFAIVYAGEDPGVEGAVVGATAGLIVGSFTYKNIILKGIAPDPFTDAKIKEIHDAGAICIVRKAGDVVTSEGTVLSGEFADVIDGIDYVTRNIAYKAQKAFNNAPKLPFDNRGISQLEAVTIGVLKEAYKMGIIAEDDDKLPIYSTDFAPRSMTSASDRKERNYKDGKFSFDPAGAIHYATINGTIEV